MNITKLTKQPQLIEITLDSPEIVAEHGEPIQFWTWDRQPLDVFLKLAQSGEDNGSVITLVKDLILDEHGTPVITDGVMLPTNIMLAAIQQITARLGK